MKIQFYWLLFIACSVSLFFIPFLIPYGGVTSDSVHYFRLAQEIPDVKWSIFPLGFPLILKFFNFFIQDYFWSGKAVSIVVFLTIGLFSYFRKFHFKETVVLLATKIIFYSFFNSISESVFLALMYFLFYYLYEYFEGRKKSYSFYLIAALLVTLMFAVRYSALYIAVGIGLFYLFHYFNNRKSLHFFKNDFFTFLLLSFAGIGCYMVFNYINFGDFAGEKYRNKPYMTGLGEDFYRNVVSVFNSFNPVLGIKLNGLSRIIFMVEGVLFLINLVFIYFSIKIWRNYIKKNTQSFHSLLIITGLVYTFFLFVTIFFQGIEELNIRLLAESSFCYFYSLIFICFKEKIYEKQIFALAVFSLIFNSLYVIKVPEYYLKRKATIEAQFSTMKGKKYFYIDDKDQVRIDTYRIPIINKEVKYEHLNMQDASINGNIIMTKDPSVFWILKDTVKNKSEMIYSSELRNID